MTPALIEPSPLFVDHTTDPATTRVTGIAKTCALPVFLSVLLLALSSAHSLEAAPGDLDTSFGPAQTGKVTPRGPDSGSALAIQTDGKIVVGGTSGGHCISDFALARFLPNGDLDTTFGTPDTSGLARTGLVITDFSPCDIGSALAIQTDGKIVVVGTSSFSTFGTLDFALARYLPNGDLDTTFGTPDTSGLARTGQVTTDFADLWETNKSSDEAFAVAIQSDGKIVVAGTSSAARGDVGVAVFALARYLPNGDLDTTFGNPEISGLARTGKVTTDFAGNAQAFAVAIQGDKIVVAGFSDGDFALARYEANGNLDTSFGSGGKVTTDFGGDNDGASALAIQTDGKIVAAGTASVGVGVNFALARYDPNGSLDTDFGSGGKVTTDFGPNTQAFGVAIQTDGKIVAAGASDFGFALARYEAGLVGSGPCVTDSSTPERFTLQKGRLFLDSHPHRDTLALRGTFVAPANSIDPPADGVTVGIRQGDTLIECLDIPPGATGWKKSRGPEWVFRDKKDGSLGDPDAKERISIKFNKKKRLFELTVTITTTDFSMDPAAGDITTSVIIGEREFADTQEWRSRAGGRKLITP